MTVNVEKIVEVQFTCSECGRYQIKSAKDHLTCYSCKSRFERNAEGQWTGPAGRILNVKEFTIFNFKCPRCGERQAFSGNQNLLQCRYCPGGARQDVEGQWIAVKKTSLGKWEEVFHV